MTFDVPYFAAKTGRIILAAPVVDAERRLLGVVSVDDVLDHLLPEDWRGREVEEDDDDNTDGYNPDDTGRIKVWKPTHGS